MNQGKLSEVSLERSVIKAVKKYRIAETGIGVDAVFSEFNAVSSASITGNEDGVLEIAFYRAVNSMAAAGGRAKAVCVTITVPRTDAEENAKRLIAELDKACKKTGIKIAHGNTSVSDNPEATVSVTALGNKEIELEKPDIKDGYIIMIGNAGNAGSALLAAQHFKALNERYTGEFIGKCTALLDDVPIHEKILETEKLFLGKIACHDVSSGGVCGAIRELCVREGCGCRVDMSLIPVKQATVEVCEYLDINPYTLMGDGAAVAIVGEEPAENPAFRVIGRTAKGNDRVLVRGEEIRFLEPNRTDDYYNVRKDRS